MKRMYFSSCLLMAAVLVCPVLSAQTIDLASGRWIDLSHSYDDRTVFWPTADGFEKETVFEGDTDGGWYYTAYNIRTAEHGGTHIDAPIHFARDRQTVEQIPLQRLIGSAVVVDISESAASNADYQLSVEDLQSWESQHGPIPADSILLIRSGFASRWPNAGCYMGTNQKGPEAVADLHFPGIHPDAARWLVAERQISAIGIDTPSLDFGQSKDFMTHRVLFDKNIPGFENLASMAELPPTGAVVFALPMKIAGGSGGPLRVVAWVNE